MHIEHQEYLTVSEAAQLLRISPDAIRRWARTGYLKADKVGLSGQYRIRPEDLQEMLNRPR